METTTVMKILISSFGDYFNLLEAAKFDYDQKKMLSGIEIFNFFVSDHLKLERELPWFYHSHSKTLVWKLVLSNLYDRIAPNLKRKKHNFRLLRTFSPLKVTLRPTRSLGHLF